MIFISSRTWFLFSINYYPSFHSILLFFHSLFLVLFSYNYLFPSTRSFSSYFLSLLPFPSFSSFFTFYLILLHRLILLIHLILLHRLILPLNRILFHTNPLHQGVAGHFDIGLPTLRKLLDLLRLDAVGIVAKVRMIVGWSVLSCGGVGCDMMRWVEMRWDEIGWDLTVLGLLLT